ncbi:unnamed protein product [Soboliphyme baturini]|uniref:Uncharacterized protein n=1 Tax=Soboliphyme baturini TaxID=241478 RepID=A0A183ILM5_9BILA|nr:unnamed protein product [Soboliphyme baturini]
MDRKAIVRSHKWMCLWQRTLPLPVYSSWTLRTEQKTNRKVKIY